MDYILIGEKRLMYTLLVFATAIVFSAGVVSRGTGLGVETYKVIGIGTLYGSFGCLVIIAISSLFGEGFSSQINQNIDIMSSMLAENAEYAKLFGLDNMSTAEMTEFYRKLYQTMALLLPSVFIIWSAVAAYAECAAAHRILRKKDSGFRKMKPVREFSLTRSGLIGWVAVSMLAWVLNYAEVFSFSEAVNANVYVLFRAVFAFQGISLIAYIFHMRGWPRPLWVILTVILMVSNIGSTVLYVSGIVDALVNLKGKIGVRV